MTRTNDSYSHVVDEEECFVISTFPYYYQSMVIQVNSATEGDGELEGVLRDFVLNNCSNFTYQNNGKKF